MSWDLAFNAEIGDLLFSPSLDLLGATGDGLTTQRIYVRCKIPRGTWQYDEDGTLGSRITSVSRSVAAQQVQDLPNLVREALEPMDDIHVDDVQVQVDDENRLIVSVSYTPIDDTSDSVDPVPLSTLPSIDSTVTL
jgi:phage gp46-like protein